MAIFKPQLYIIYQEIDPDAPPAATTDLNAHVGLRSVTFNWQASMSANTIGYNIYRRQNPEDDYTRPLNAQLLTTLSYEDDDLSLGRPYQYVVKAFDNKDRVSLPSNQVEGVQIIDNDADNDNDGMFDTYEIAHGLDPLDPSDAAIGQDQDVDGFDNIDEFLAGTSASDPNDYPVANNGSRFAKNDFDGDGDSDILTRNSINGVWETFEMEDGTVDAHVVSKFWADQN